MTDLNDNFTVAKINYIVERRNVPDWQKKLVYPDNYVMVYTFEGECTYKINNREITVQPKDIYIFKPGVVRSGKSNPEKPWTFISINFSLLDDSCPLPEQICGLFHNTEYYVEDMFLKIGKKWVEESAAYRLKCRTLTQEILCSILIQTAKEPIDIPHLGRIIQAKKYIQKNYLSAIVIEDLITASGLSASQFRKLFKKIVGYSPSQYAIFLRLNKANSLLESGEANVSEAALSCGFSDLFYFSSLYKKRFGIPPSRVYLKDK